MSADADDDGPAVPADLAALIAAAMQGGRRMQAVEDEVRRELLLGYADDIEAGKPPARRQARLIVAQALRDFVAGRPCTPKKRGNPTMVAGSLWNPPLAAWEVHEYMRREGASLTQATQALAERFGVDESALAKVYRKHAQLLRRIDARRDARPAQFKE